MERLLEKLIDLTVVVTELKMNNKFLTEKNETLETENKRLEFRIEALKEEIKSLTITY